MHTVRIIIPLVVLLLVIMANRDASAQVWAQQESMPHSRVGASAVSIGPHIYVLGGSSPDRDFEESVVRFNVDTGLWDDDVDELRKARIHAAAVAYDNKILLIGGRSGDDILDDVEVYDPRVNEWDSFPNLVTERQGAAAVVSNGQVFVIGGSNEAGELLESVEVYNPIEEDWIQIDEWGLDRASASLQAVSTNGSIFLIGGLSALGPLSSVHRYSSDSGIVSQVSMPEARGNFAAVAVEDTVFVLGGVSDREKILSNVRKLTPDADAWTEVSGMSVARESFAAVVVEGTIYAIGGRDDHGEPLRSMESLPVDTSVGIEYVDLPEDFGIRSSYPNPFRETITIEFDVSNRLRNMVRVDVFDILGRRVRTLANAQLPGGRQELTWSGESESGHTVGSGLYIVRVIQDSSADSQRIVYVNR